MSEPRIIDTAMHGRRGITAAWIVAGERTALVETGPKSSADNVLGGLADAGVDRLDWIVVTHIHLDHAGGAGTLAGRFPDARVAVHGVGAPHLVDPAKLWSSAARIYGDDMERLWGGIDPVARDRVVVLGDGDEIDLGGRSLSAVETPGHARHHHAYLDSETGAVFAGDALGVRLQDLGVVRPATPPPEFHLEDAINSIERIRALSPSAIYLTHFGGQTPATVDEVCDEAAAALRSWESWVVKAREQTDDLDRVAAFVRDQARNALEANMSPDAVDRMENTTSYRMNAWGYMRYLDKRQ